MLDEGSSEATVTVNSVSEKFYILKPGDITLDHSIHHEKTILADGPVNFLRPYLNSNTGTDYTTSNKYNQDTAFYIVNISRDPVQLLINNEEDAYVASEGKMHSLERYAVELSEFIVSEQTDGYFKHITTEINPEIAFAYPGTLLDHLKKYNIFGIELALKLNIYTEEISEGDAFKLNSYFEPNADDMIEAGEYYKIGGIGAADVRNLNIINTTYENVKIGSVSVKESLADNAALEAKIKALFDERQVVMQDQFYRWSVDTAGGKEFDTYSGQSIVPKFLSKNKTLALGVNELLTPNYLAVASDVGGGYTSIGCSAFGGEDLLVPSEVLAMDDAVVLSFLLKINTNLGARILKKQSVEASLFSSKTDGARSITGFSDDVDIVLPKRRLIKDGFSFVIVNGSRSNRAITSCEGINIDSSSSLVINAGSAKKITLSDGDFTSSDITVEELANGLYSTDLKAFVLTKRTDQEYLIRGTDVGISTKIINNTGADIALRAKEATSEYFYTDKVVGASRYSDIKNTHGNALSIANGNDSKKFTLIKDGAANISRAAYENKVVLFNSERVRHFIQSDTTMEDSFFSTFFVPFLNATKVKKDDDKIARMYGYPVSYNVENDKAPSSSERVSASRPVSW